MEIDLIDVEPAILARAARLEPPGLRTLDAINSKWGKGKLHYAGEDISSSWQPKHHLRSPRYVSYWDELPEARIRPQPLTRP